MTQDNIKVTVLRHEHDPVPRYSYDVKRKTQSKPIAKHCKLITIAEEDTTLEALTKKTRHDKYARVQSNFSMKDKLKSHTLQQYLQTSEFNEIMKKVAPKYSKKLKQVAPKHRKKPT